MDGQPREDEIEAAVPYERRQSRWPNYDNAEWRVAGDDPRWSAHIENSCRATEEVDAAAIALVSNDTLSPGGAVALLDYVATIEPKTPDRGLLIWSMTMASARRGITSWSQT